jgi:hypothetical protein
VAATAGGAAAASLMLKAIVVALLIGVALALALWRDLPAKRQPSPVIHGRVV